MMREGLIPWWMPQPEPAQSRPNPACATAPRFPENESVTPTRIQGPKLPDWFWNGEPASSGASQVQPSIESAAETHVLSESRIERLRELFANVGLADLHRNRAPLSEIAEEIQHQNEAPASGQKAEAESSVAAPTETQPDVAPAPVTGLPREFVPVKEPVQDDDIRILPAKRGQYGSR